MNKTVWFIHCSFIMWSSISSTSTSLVTTNSWTDWSCQNIFLHHSSWISLIFNSCFHLHDDLRGHPHIRWHKIWLFFTLPPYYDTMMTLWSDPSLPMMTGDTWHSHIIIEYRSSALKHDIIFERFLRRNKETKKCKFEATLKNVYKIALTAA